MTGHWWQCDKCEFQSDFRSIVDCGIVAFFWDILSKDWEQGLLVRDCTQCGEKSMRITYKFPRSEQEVISTYHIVGLSGSNFEYLPMLWEGTPRSDPHARWFDFKYLGDQRKRGAYWGLNKPAVLTSDDLRRLIDLYEAKTGSKLFA